MRIKYVFMAPPFFVLNLLVDQSQTVFFQEANVANLTYFFITQKISLFIEKKTTLHQIFMFYYRHVMHHRKIL